MNKELKKRRKFLKEHYEDRRKEIEIGKQKSREAERARAVELESLFDRTLKGTPPIPTLREAARGSLEYARNVYLETVTQRLRLLGFNEGNINKVKRRAFAKGKQFIEFFFDTRGGREDLLFIGVLTIGKQVRGVKTFDVAIKTLDDPSPDSVFIIPE